MKITYLNPEKEKWFLVSWTLSNKCNYRCNYCPSNLHDGTTGQPQWEVVENFVKNFSQPDKTICYRLSGGEPTYWKHFTDLARLVKTQGDYFSFLTNGSQSVEYYKEISKYSDAIMMSYHEEYSNVQHFIDIANAVECPIVVNLMMVQSKFDEIVGIAKQMYDNTEKLAIWPKLVLDKTSDNFITNNVSNYTIEQKTLIKAWPYFRTVDDSKVHRGELLLCGKPVTGNDLIIQNLNHHKGWECWAGLHMISVDMWGDIYRSECQQGGTIGNLKSYTAPTTTITCGKDKCSCLSDVYLRKESKSNS
jgi:organic radical activating enzyme